MSKRTIGLIIFILLGFWFGFKPHHPTVKPQTQSHHQSSTQTSTHHTSSSSADNAGIESKTDAVTVAHYIDTHHQLPDFYVRKHEARQHGWSPAKGNLCDVMPGHAIGGDHFGNREGRLPNQAGIKWFEADVNYQCGRRNADRLLYSSDGLVFLTTDHYKTFKRMN